MGFITFRDWLYTKLGTVTDLTVNKYPTDKISGTPFVYIDMQGVEEDDEQRTSRTTKRLYRVNVRLIVFLGEGGYNNETGEDVFLSKVDDIIELFDDADNRKIGAAQLVVLDNIELSRKFIAKGQAARVADFYLSLMRINQ